MDIWKYYSITHREHVVLNPTSEDNLTRLIELLRLERGARVADFGSGKGEFLIRLAETYDVVGLGVDISPYFIEDARQRQARRMPQAHLNFVRADGASAEVEPQTLHMASCIGASWIFGGYQQTLQSLTRMVVSEGWVIIGEPYLRRDPSPDYLKASDDADGVGTHLQNAEAGERFGLNFVLALVSDERDFDLYDGLQWYAADQYACTHPDDPDLPELMERIAKTKSTFLRWGRDTIGWAIYMFRRTEV